MKYLILTCALVASSAFAYTSCFWQKVSETNGVNGQKVCVWKCGFGTDVGYRTTSGYGYCPTPR